MQTNMGPPGFSDTAATDLGSDGTPADGFDGLLATLAQAIADESGFLPRLDSLIGAMDFSPGTFADGGINSLISDFAGFLSTGNSLADAINSAVAGGVSAPPPPNTPAIYTTPVATPPVHGGITVGGGTQVGGEPPWFDPTNPRTWADASGGGSMIPEPPFIPRTS